MDRPALRPSPRKDFFCVCVFSCFPDRTPAGWRRLVSSDGGLWDRAGHGERPGACAPPRWHPQRGRRLSVCTRPRPPPPATLTGPGVGRGPAPFTPARHPRLCRGELRAARAPPGPRMRGRPEAPRACLYRALTSPALSQALRSHDHSTKPLYVSVGHKISLEAAVRLTRGCCRFRIPEPVRQVGGPACASWTSLDAGACGRA